MTNSLMDREHLIVSNMLECLKTIKRLKLKNLNESSNMYLPNSFKLFENEKYQDNLSKLFENVTGTQYNFSSITKDENVIKFNSFRNNQYAYLKELNSLFESYQIGQSSLLKSLNESINDSTNIDSFISDLRTCIKEFEKNNDFDKLDALPDTVKKIKIWANKEINILGFDISNNYHLREELVKNYNFDIRAIFSILFDRTYKQLLFVIPGNVFVYDLATDTLGKYNEINNNKIIDKFTNEKLFISNIINITPLTYKDIIYDSIGRNLQELYFNIETLNIKFTDNLYNDAAREKWLKENKGYKDNKNFVNTIFKTDISNN